MFKYYSVHFCIDLGALTSVPCEKALTTDQPVDITMLEVKCDVLKFDNSVEMMKLFVH